MKGAGTMRRVFVAHILGGGGSQTPSRPPTKPPTLNGAGQNSHSAIA